MGDWYESSIDRQLREAAERGEFDNLKGLGKPLPDHGREYDEDWWVKDWLAREGTASAVLPATLALRREADDIEARVDRLGSEREVRDYVDELNQRLHRARVGLVDGPALPLPPRDADAVIAAWRQRRSR